MSCYYDLSFEEREDMARNEMDCAMRDHIRTLTEQCDKALELTSFDEREMRLIRAIFAGDVSAARLREGGDYTYTIWNQGMSEEEMDAFLEKVG